MTKLMKKRDGKTSSFRPSKHADKDEPVQKQLTPYQIATKNGFEAVDEELASAKEYIDNIKQELDAFRQEYGQDKEKYNSDLAKISDDQTKVLNTLAVQKKNISTLNENITKDHAALVQIAKTSTTLTELIKEGTVDNAPEPNEMFYISSMEQHKWDPELIIAYTDGLKVLDSKGYSKIEDVKAAKAYTNLQTDETSDEINLEAKAPGAMRVPGKAYTDLVIGVKRSDISAPDEELEKLEVLCVYNNARGSALRVPVVPDKTVCRGEGAEQEVLFYFPAFLTPDIVGMDRIGMGLIYDAKQIYGKPNEEQKQPTEGD